MNVAGDLFTHLSLQLKGAEARSEKPLKTQNGISHLPSHYHLFASVVCFCTGLGHGQASVNVFTLQYH